MMRLGQKAAFSRIDKTAGCEKEIRPGICYYVQGREGRKKVFTFSFLFFLLCLTIKIFPRYPAIPFPPGRLPTGRRADS